LIEFAEPLVFSYEAMMKNRKFDRNVLNQIVDVLSGLASHKHPRIFSLMERVGNAMVPNLRGMRLFIDPINEINNIVWKYTGNEKYRTQLTP